MICTIYKYIICKIGKHGKLMYSKTEGRREGGKERNLLETSPPPHGSVNLNHTAQVSPLQTEAPQPLQFPLRNLLLRSLVVFLTFLGNLSNFTVAFPRCRYQSSTPCSSCGRSKGLFSEKMMFPALFSLAFSGFVSCKGQVLCTSISRMY